MFYGGKTQKACKVWSAFNDVIYVIEQPANLHLLSVSRYQHKEVKPPRKQSPEFSG